MKDWDEVTKFALKLAASKLSTSYRQPAIKVNGKAFVNTGHEPGSFAVHSPQDEKVMLIETDPDTFCQTAHYANWPSILIRYGSADPERVALVIRRAWWDRLSPKQRREAGDRP